MRTKRVVSLILSLLFILSCVPFASANGEDVSVVASFNKAQYKAGDNASLTIKTNGTKSNPVAAADFEIEYNSKYLSVTQSNKMVTSYKAGEVVKNATDLSISAPTDGNMKLLFMDNSDDRSRSIVSNGSLAVIQFKVKADINNPKSLVKLIGSGDFCSETLQIYTVAFSVDIHEEAESNTTVKAKKPYKVKGVKLTAGKKKITVKWKKAKNAKKYVVKYSYKKNMKGAKTKTTAKTKLVIKKLKSGKKVYVQVQGVNGKVKGKFSAKVSKKVK